MWALLLNPFQAGAADASAAEPAPLAIHEGGKITVPEQSPLRKRLLVASVGVKASAHALSAPAVVEANPAQVVNVLAPLTGRLVALKVGLGAQVKKGEVLLEIASPDLDQARSDAEKAADALDLAKRALERARGVMDAGANAVKDLEAAQSSYNQALAEDVRARSRLKTLLGDGRMSPQSRLLDVRAPSEGAVTALNVAAGSYVNDPTATLLTLAKLDRVWVTAQLAEHQVGAIKKGQGVDITLAAYPGQTWHGRVSLVSPLLEPDTRRTKVRIEFANADGRLKPNMFATAAFAVQQADTVTVPTSALLMNNDTTTVLVETAPWVFSRRTVELGSEDGEMVRILSGLKPGERVVTRGGVLLND
ncbi:MAG: efflux RND transporter periplasmic adaptor subunit [Burkholderiaceae bacterium]|nr:efflux RND transporter periplasmic adaptor subunit [Burkholderiaceae bacterium]